MIVRLKNGLFQALFNRFNWRLILAIGLAANTIVDVSAAVRSSPAPGPFWTVPYYYNGGNNSVIGRHGSAQSACSALDAYFSKIPIGPHTPFRAVFDNPNMWLTSCRTDLIRSDGTIAPNVEIGSTQRFYQCIYGGLATGHHDYSTSSQEPPTCLFDGPDPIKGDGLSCSAQTQTKHPIHIGSGNKVLQEWDFLASSENSPKFGRFYSSTLAKYAQTPGAVNFSHSFSGVWFGSYDNSITMIGAVPFPGVQALRNDGHVYTYTSANNAWITDADITDKLIELKDAGGVRTGWRYTVDATGEVESYDVNGKLLSIASRGGLIQTMLYSDAGTPVDIATHPGLLIEVTDSLNHSIKFTYDTSNRIKTMTNLADGITTYAYSTDGNNNLTSVTHPDGKVKTYHYENPTFPHALTGITDENINRFITYRYDATGRADEEELAPDLSLPANQKIEYNQLNYNVDASGNPISTKVTDSLGAERTYNFTTILGAVKSTGQSQPGGSGCSASASTLSYDANGNVASRTDFKGNKNTYEYDLTRNLETSRTEGLSAAGLATDATRTITTAWHTTWRLPLMVSEYTGATATGTAVKTTTNGYDAMGNLTSITETDPVRSLNRTIAITYTYSAAIPGLVLTKVVDGPRTDVADITTYTYYPHDAACTGSSAPPIDPANPMPNLGCRGQLQRVKNALNQTTTYNRYNHHGQAEQLTDANGLVTQHTYDLRQRLTSRKADNETTTLSYDNAGQIIQLQMPDSSVLNYTYDAAHRLTQVQDSLGNKVVYTLDAEGNRIQEDTKDPKGNFAKTLTRSYDALNRLQTVTGVE